MSLVDVLPVAAPPIVLTVYGRPITQGSKTKTRYGMRDDNATTLKPWREAVKTAGLEAMVGRERLLEPAVVEGRFYFERPAAHYGTGKNARVVKASAPPVPSNRTSGDIDKLLRAAFDALTDAGVWLDDSLCVDVQAKKRWAGEGDALHIPGVVLAVTPWRP